MGSQSLKMDTIDGDHQSEARISSTCHGAIFQHDDDDLEMSQTAVWKDFFGRKR